MLEPIPDVQAVNLAERFAVLDDGQIVPITHLFDGDDEVDDPARATAIVCGPLANGKWLAVDLSLFDFGAVLH